MKLPRFTLRDLFWLTALVAVCVAWWVDHARNRERLATEVNENWELRKAYGLLKLELKAQP